MTLAPVMFNVKAAPAPVSFARLRAPLVHSVELSAYAWRLAQSVMSREEYT